MSRLLIVVSLSSAFALAGCVAPAPKPNDPYYAPVLPRTPLPAAQNSGAIYQAGFETYLYDDRKAYRVGDIITITLAERTQASKNASSSISKDSSANIGLGSLFGGAVSMANPLTGNSMSLGAEYDASRDTSGSGQAGQSNSLSGSITVTVSEVLPNGILAVRGEVDDAQHRRRVGAHRRPGAPGRYRHRQYGVVHPHRRCAHHLFGNRCLRRRQPARLA